MNRIDRKFKELREKNKKALITYITAGHPSIEKTEELIYAQERGGASVIEIGIPFSDPLADGPIIQEAGQIALNNGVSINDIFEIIEKARKNTEIPLVFLLYYNTVLSFGIEKFINKCDEIGIDGLIIPDLPMEEQEEINPYIKKTNICLIPLIAPTSENRIIDIVKGNHGFVYCVSSLGVTGQKGEFYIEVEEFLKQVRRHTKLPIAVGFGISNKSHVERLKDYVDGIIVGSAIVNKVKESGGDAKVVENFIKELSF